LEVGSNWFEDGTGWRLEAIGLKPMEWVGSCRGLEVGMCGMLEGEWSLYRLKKKAKDIGGNRDE
jgi:hypothetical protein